MKTPECLGAIGGNEAKGLVYASMPEGMMETKTVVHKRMLDLQDGKPGYSPDQKTYFKYTIGYARAGLGERASSGRVRNGFISNGNLAAIALAGDLAGYSLERPWLALNDLIEVNRGTFPRIRAIHALLEHPEGLAVADLNEFVYGQGHREDTGPDTYYQQLDRHGIVDIDRLRGAGTQRDAKTRVILVDDSIDDCEQIMRIISEHGAGNQAAQQRGLEAAQRILRDSSAVRELIRKSFAASPWAQQGATRGKM